ncbi:MAG: hypothetical protein II330_07575 [Clostridia bacterium]|nr:hypothetical protein [Clostridia bacterium]
MMEGEAPKITPFYEDVYLYDLNHVEAPPLAYRSARGGEEQPDLLSLIDLPAAAWSTVMHQLHCGAAVYLSSGKGAVLLPAFGSIGRFAVVIKTSLSLPTLSYVAQCAGQGEIYADAQIRATKPQPAAGEREMAESAVHTVALLRLLMQDCLQAHNAYDVGACIDCAASIMGVDLMPQDKAEISPMQGQGILPGMQYSGQVLFVCMLVLLSQMRNQAHGRSGWLYAVPCEGGYTLQAYFCCVREAELAPLDSLRSLLENGGVALGTRQYGDAIKPPRQYAYMSAKITDPRKPLCARCRCLDAHCSACTAVQWAVLPYVCDVALLGIKAEPYFKE